MARPNLDAAMKRLDEACRDYLAETIRYQPDGGTFGEVLAYVDYPEQIAEFGNASVAAQTIRVSVLRADLAAKPVGADRLKLARQGSKIFKPVNVVLDEAGTHWEFDLETVSG